MSSDETRHTRLVKRPGIGLAYVAGLIILFVTVALVTIHVVTANYVALQNAALKGDMFAVRCFLWKGTDVDAKGGFSATSLDFAAIAGQAEVVELLIEKGADVNAKEDMHGWTPLHRAASEGHKDVAVLLIENGAKVSAKDNEGKTPLDVAKSEAMCQLLKEHGAVE